MRVGLLFGGRSVEHEVSIASATSILGALDPARYDVQLLAVDPEGRWHLSSRALPPESAVSGREVLLPAVPGGGALVPADGGDGILTQLDVIFPIIHGRGGEDGGIQGLLELADVPYVGAGVLSSAAQMDKDVAKRLLQAAGLPVVPWVTYRAPELMPERIDAALDRALTQIGLPAFVKPANSGSSVGIARASDRATLRAALLDAVRYDTKVLVEQGVDAREIEVAVLGNDEPEASVPGEIVPHDHEFYDYEAKYADEETELLVPAPLSPEESERLRTLALEAYRVLDGQGMARVDFLVDRETGDVRINELNSLPGFTEVSMYPRLWEASGLPYPALIDRLIELALERHATRSKLETTYRRG
ncbi:MAG: D-alanine--D-alanine ligase [Proteobacteria bacterium]|nr:D-alanine--D-alanine ligase [Pseudomonadota bacterium]